MLKKNRGITLIALVIMIIVLLIMAGITVRTLIGDDGMIEKAIMADEKTRYGVVYEAQKLWETEKYGSQYVDLKYTSASEIINRLYNDGHITKEERDTLLEGKSITIDGKEISFGMEDGKLYFYTELNYEKDNIAAYVIAKPRIGGIPEYQTYEQYINPRPQIEEMTEEEKIALLVTSEATNYASTYANSYPGQEITLDLVLQRYSVASIEELITKNNYETLDDFLIYKQAIGKQEYQDYTTDYNNNYKKNVSIIKHDGQTINGSNMYSSSFSIFENGTYTIKASYDGQEVSKVIDVSNIAEPKGYELSVIDKDTYGIYKIEDLLKFERNVNIGVSNYQGKTIKLMNSLDFQNNSSYQNPFDEETFGDYNNDGIIQGIKDELTNKSAIGFIPIGSKYLMSQKTYNIKYFNFNGTFDGNDNELRNIYIRGAANEANFGLFGNNYGVIKNLKIFGEYTNYATSRYITLFMGGITSKNYGSIINCENNIRFNITQARYLYLGGITAYNYGANIENCNNNANILLDENNSVLVAYAGGLIGFLENGSSKIICCNNKGNIEFKDMIGVTGGGIVGLWKTSGKVINCINSGSMTISNMSQLAEIGGIVGYKKWGGMYNCLNIGEINADLTGTTSTNYVGGIAGDEVAGGVYVTLNVAPITVVGSSNNSNKSLIGGSMGCKYYSVYEHGYNVGTVTVTSIPTEKCGSLIGNGWGELPTGGYKANLGPSRGVGNQTSWLEDSMELDAETLADLLNEAASLETYLTATGESSLAEWIVDENISTEYPILNIN